MKKLVLAVLGMAAVLAGCASPKPESQEFALMAAQKQQEAQTKVAKTAVDEAPTWYLSPPADAANMYAAGTATSVDMQMALDKAGLNAKRMIADQVRGKISSDFKDYLEESGAASQPEIAVHGERVIRDVVAEVALQGYEVTQRKVLPSGTGFRAFVLIRYPLAAADRLLVDDVKQDRELATRLRASKAFEDLEREIQDTRKRDHPAAANDPAPPVAAPRAEAEPEPEN